MITTIEKRFNQLVDQLNYGYLGEFIIDIYHEKDTFDQLVSHADRLILEHFKTNTYKMSDLVKCSLVYLGIKHYDGSFYKHIYNAFGITNQEYSYQTFENKIREMIKNWYKTEDRKRYVTLILSNCFVPVNYLPGFFDLIEDIFKVNFNYNPFIDDFSEASIEKELFRVMKSIFSKNEISDDVIRLEVQNSKMQYKVTQGTQRAFIDDGNIEKCSHILMDILQIIDSDYWERGIHNNIRKEYLKIGYDKWKDQKRSNSTTKSDTRQNYSRPYFKELSINNRVLLSISEIDIANLDFDSDLVLEIYGAKGLMYKFNSKSGQFIATRIFGGWRVKCKDIEISNPFQGISYCWRLDEEIIYETRDSLKVNYLMFDKSRKAINRSNNYNGNIFILTKSDIVLNYPSDNIGETKLYYASVSIDEPILIEGKQISFYRKDKLTAEGKIIRNASANYNNESYLIYTSIESLTVMDLNGLLKFIEINGKRHFIENLVHNETYENGIRLLEIELPKIEKEGLYEISAINDYGISLGKLKCIIDPIFKLETLIEGNVVELSLESSFVDKKGIVKKMNLKQLGSTLVGVLIDGNNFEFDLGYSIARYKLENSKATTFKFDAWGPDIGEYIEFRGFEPREMRLYVRESQGSRYIRKVNFTRVLGKESCYRVRREEISDALIGHSQLNIAIDKANGETETLIIINSNRVHGNIKAQIMSQTLDLELRFSGKNEYQVDIFDGYKLLHKSVINISGTHKYQIGKSKNINLNIYEMLPDAFGIYRRVLITHIKDIERIIADSDRFFEIKAIMLMNDKNYTQVRGYTVSNLIPVNKDSWKGTLVYKEFNKVDYLSKLNPVNLKLVKKTSAGAMVFEITDKEMDGLLYDTYNSKISTIFGRKFRDIDRIVCKEGEL